VTVSPEAGWPSILAMAPENIHGCRRKADFSRPGFKVMVGIKKTGQPGFVPV
jgi:hypothetical protein